MVAVCGHGLIVFTRYQQGNLFWDILTYGR